MRVLLLTYALLLLLLTAAALLLIILSLVWRCSDNVLITWIIAWVNEDYTLALGGLYLSAVFLGVVAIMRPKWEGVWLKCLAWYLIFMAFCTLVVASMIWLLSLRELFNFEQMWSTAPGAIQARLQDEFECCGYRNATISGGFTSSTGFCATASTSKPGCMIPVTLAADQILAGAFTTIYAFEAIIVGLFLTTLCVVNTWAIEVRFRRIDEKRGGGGFV